PPLAACAPSWRHPTPGPPQPRHGDMSGSAAPHRARYVSMSGGAGAAVGQVLVAPGAETADDVGGVAQAEGVQGCRGQAGGVALRAEHYDLQVVASDLRQAGIALGVEAPLQ